METSSDSRSDALNISLKVRLFGAGLRGFPVKEFVVDPSIQFVHVHGVDTVLKESVFRRAREHVGTPAPQMRLIIRQVRRRRRATTDSERLGSGL